MKLKIIVVIISIITSYCNAQIGNCKLTTNYKPKKRTEMKILNKEVANHVVSNKTYKYFEVDTLITINKPNKRVNYIQTVIYPNTNFRDIAIYDKESLKLKSEGQTFINMPVGIYNIYGEDGKIVSTINYDEKYPISIENVIQILKNELKIDINENVEGLNISREISNVEQIPIYDIYIPQEKTEIKVRHIKVDGSSGKITMDQIEVAQQ